MKLELKHLAPYLPYGLNIDTSYWDDEPSPIGKNIISEMTQDDVICSYGWASTHGRMIQQEYSIDRIKPILRPLSDLTKDIEHNGEKFVALVKLYETAYYGIFKYVTPYKINFIDQEDNSLGLVVRDEDEERNGFTLNFPTDHYNWFEFRLTLDNENLSHNMTLNQFQLFEKLFEWHFDVFGLIEKGLAIDINTINP